NAAGASMQRQSEIATSIPKNFFMTNHLPFIIFILTACTDNIHNHFKPIIQQLFSNIKSNDNFF
ncbi:MAG: hypothetical protein ACI4XE_07025, partial [Acutalibacteraceae bacterium]